MHTVNSTAPAEWAIWYLSVCLSVGLSLFISIYLSIYQTSRSAEAVEYAECISEEIQSVFDIEVDMMAFDK